MRTLLLTLTTCLFVLPASAKYSGGTGEPNDPYQIATAADLIALGETPEDYDKHLLLTADIDLDPNLPGRKVFDKAVIAPDTEDVEGGYQGTPFVGVLDGGGHTIWHLTIVGESYLGLVGCLASGSEIRDLAVADVNIAGSGDFVGGLVGATGARWTSQEGGAVNHCSSSGVVTGAFCLGGLVGLNVDGDIMSCDSDATVTGKGRVGSLLRIREVNVTVTRSYDIGGLAGQNWKGRISYSHSHGPVTGDSGIGGLVGNNGDRDSAVRFCYSTSGTTGESGTGGLVGSNLGSVSSSYSTGSVTGTAIEGGTMSRASGGGVGGLVGRSSGVVSFCYATGSVTPLPQDGGLVGHWEGGIIEDSYFLAPAAGGGPDKTIGIALTESEMRRRESFVGWDFWGTTTDGVEDHWFIAEDSPPILSWQTEITGLNRIPDLAALGRDDAVSLMERAGFTLGAIESDYHRSIPKEHVILSCPRYAPRSAPVDLVLSLGPYDWQDNSGDGFATRPYEIKSAGQLESLTDHPELWNRDFALLDDIDMSGRSYRGPLVGQAVRGEATRVQGIPFAGSFDGNGHTIRHLTINGLEYSEDFLGLFAWIGVRGQVANLGIENAMIRGASSMYVGALAGMNEGRISSCYSTGTVAGWGIVAGGLVGDNWTGSVVSCYSAAVVRGYYYVGGLVGGNGFGHISYCHSTGTVTGEDYVGGIAGVGVGVVYLSYWDVETSGQLTSAGGKGKTTSQMKAMETFRGWGSSGQWSLDEGQDYPRLTWQANAGPVVTDLPRNYGGGTGEPNDPYRIQRPEDLATLSWHAADFDKCFVLVADVNLAGMDPNETMPIGTRCLPFTGVFDGAGHRICNLMLTASQSNYVGLFGYVGGASDSQGSGLVGVVRNLGMDNVDISGSQYVGALAGCNAGKLSSCCIMGGTVRGLRTVGGLVGENIRGEVASCYSRARVEGTYVVGGLVGDNQYGIITSCYSAGGVEKTENAGGLIGVSTPLSSSRKSNIRRSYWDVQSSRQTTSAAGTGKTTAEMQMAKTFIDAGWDFVGETFNGKDDIWWILEGKDYPRLWWEQGDKASP